MAASALEGLVLFLYNASRERNRKYTETKHAARTQLSYAQLQMLPLLLTAKQRLGHRPQSKLAKAHLEELSTSKSTRNIDTCEKLTTAIGDMTVYRAISNSALRTFVYQLLFQDVVTFFGPAWMREVCPNAWRYLFPQLLEHEGLEMHGVIRPTTIDDLSELPADFRILEIKINGHCAIGCLYANGYWRFVSRGGETKWGRSTVLYDRTKFSACKPPDNPGALRFMFHGEIVAFDGVSRLPAHEATNVGIKKVGVYVVWDILYCSGKWKYQGKAYRNSDYRRISQYPLKLRRQLLTQVVSHYNEAVVYSDEAASASNAFIWLVPTVTTDEEIEEALKNEEGIVVKYEYDPYYGICPSEQRNSLAGITKAWRKLKKRNKTIDVVVRGGSAAPRDPSLPGSLDMLVLDNEGNLVSLEHRVPGLSAEDVAYLEEIGVKWGVNGTFSLARDVYAEVVVDMQDGVLRHPRIVRFRELSEGFTISCRDEVYA